jgi:hypothetical protein
MEDIFMSDRETERYEILCRVQRKELQLSMAARLMSVGYRQAKRLWRDFKQNGKAGLVSKKRGRRSNRAIALSTKEQALELIKSKYWDFGPTFAAEKLEELHGIKLSSETVRLWMIEEGLYIPEKKKVTRVHQRRLRRECLGELSQSDGSHHAWFEGRGPKVTLLATIDDATNEVTGRFEEEETTNGYLRLYRDYIETNGRPLQLYVDKYSVFRVNQGDNLLAETQFSRAMKRLQIEVICAHSPQAKGRVERLFGTLQDRLVKELRLRGISTIEEANAFLPDYFEGFNRRFRKKPASPINAHRPLKQDTDLKPILCHRETRKVTKNLEIHYKNQLLQLKAVHRARRLRGVTVEVLETLEDGLLVEYKGELLDFSIFEELVSSQAKVQDHKQLVEEWDRRCWRSRHKPRRNHPWRRLEIKRRPR